MNDEYNDDDIDDEDEMADLYGTVGYRIIRLLDERGGFDHWWGRIDPDIQREIIEELNDTFGPRP